MIPGKMANLSYLAIETNSSCNLACVTCNRKDLEQNGLRKPKNISLQDFELMLDQLAGSSINTIKLEGLSEPMLHPQFDLLAEALRRRFPKAFVIIATNLQYEVSRTVFLKTLPFVDMVYLSIDGIGQTYENARRGAKFDKLLRSLETVRRDVGAEIRGKKLHINFTATIENYRELPAIYELRNQYGLASVRINLAQNWNEHEINSRAIPVEMIDFLRTYRADVKGVPGWNYRDCFWVHSGTVIDVFGDVRQCLINTSQEPLGNIFKTSLKEIFENSPRLNEARAHIMQNKPAKSCVGCDYHHLSQTLREIFKDSPDSNQPRAWSGSHV